jgi:hypothetical protein
VSQKAQKSVEKSAENIWKCHFFAVTLHPLSHRKTVLESSRKGVLKNFLKKVSEKFGGFKKMTYLCTAFPLLKIEWLRLKVLMNN